MNWNLVMILLEFIIIIVLVCAYYLLKRKNNNIIYENVDLLVKYNRLRDEKISKKINELWEIQEVFNKKFFITKERKCLVDLTNKEKVHYTKEFILHLFREVAEVLNVAPFKMHRKYSEKEHDVKLEIIEELIDVQKFLWGIFNVWGISFKEFAMKFKEKSRIVEERFKKEMK